MASEMKLCIFGDQTCDLTFLRKDLLNLRTNPAVEDFLSKAYDAVRREIFTLPPNDRDRIPRFTGINDLILYSNHGERSVAVDTAVSCIYQLGFFIGTQADSWYQHQGKRLIAGLCLGGLASAAVSCSSSTLDLIPRAIDAVVAAFRCGMHATETAARLVPQGLLAEGDENWSALFSGVQTLEALDRFCEQNRTSLASKPYVSASSGNTVTLSGPPHILTRLITSEPFKQIKSRKLPVFAPFHASHIFSDIDVAEIVSGLGITPRTERLGKRSFLSSKGSLIDGVDFATLLRDAVDAIMVQPMRFSPMLDVLQTQIQAINPQRLDLIPIATTADRLIFNTFKDTPLGTLVPPPAPPGGKLKSDSLYGIPPNNPSTPKLAIIGMSGRFPSANSTDAFWDLLHQGLDVHKAVPPDRWNESTHVDPTGTRKNTGAVPWGCWIEDAGLFDARFFNISPREAPQIDPAQRLALMTVYEAVERSGIVVNRTPSTRGDRVGVFYGVTGNDWAETNSAQDIDTYLIPGGNRAFIPGRINYFYKFSGPSYAVDTACSSAMSAIHIACNSLWRGDTDTAIAGGTNIMTNPDFHAGLDRGHFLSRTGNCKTFDDGADGYCRAEGVGTVIMKRLDDALADNDPILGVILDASTNHSSESESITRPYAGAQRDIFRKVLNEGGIDPYSVGYIEMHGTGTQVGDATEMSSVLSTFAPPLPDVPRGRSQDETLYLGSAKANIGHGEASSGSSALIKVLLMMQNNMIVPHCGIKTKINHKFPTDMDVRNVHIARKPVPWERPSDPRQRRRALINNFSAAGGNSAILLEDAPLPVEDADAQQDPRNAHLIAVSAKSGASIQGNLKSLLSHLRRYPDVPMGQLSYTTTARRMHHQHRIMFVASSDTAELSNQIEKAIDDNIGMTRPKSAPKIVFTFTGQGAQFSGMARSLLEHEFFRKEMHRLDQICQTMGFPSMLPVIEGQDDQDINAFAPVSVQLASICLQISLSKLWASMGVTPSAVAGHSLGEYAALNAAGVLSDADTIYLTGKRADALQKLCTRETHSMLVVRASVDEISTILRNSAVEFACINSPVETVIAGPVDAIKQAESMLSESGRKTTLLRVPFAFHSSQLDPMLSELLEIASGVTFSKPKIPVICPLTGEIASDDGVFGPQYLVRHSRRPVNMLKALQTARTANIITDQTAVIEIGPHPAVGGMVRAVLGSQVPTLPSLQRGRSSWQVMGTTLKHLYTGGTDIRWAGYHAGFKASHRVLPLPSYNWDLKHYWIPYVHDWSLRKGDPPLMVGNSSALESTTVHRIVEETEVSNGLRLVVEANIARPDLSPLVCGHEVDGIPLCTPSIYADIGLTVGKYLLSRHWPGQESLVDISDMVISKALILRSGISQQPLQAHCDVDWIGNSTMMRFVSFDKTQKLQEHARCVAHFRDMSLQRNLQDEVAMLNEKLAILQNGVASGDVARYNRAMCYRAIRPLARFHPDYQAANEVLLDSRTLECSSRLRFDTIKRGTTKFHTHPAIIDALTQSCGFAMNCNDHADLDKDVYMNHGWGSLQLFEPLDYENEYRTYTRMEEGASSIWHGDVVVLNRNDKVVAHFGQIAIQCVPRRLLKAILAIEAGSKSGHQQPDQPAQQPPPSNNTAVSAIISHSNSHVQSSLPSQDKTQRTAAISRNSQSACITKALDIVAQESGLAVRDLTDVTAFSDAGIDSLLGLTISARLKDEVDMDVDFNSLLFTCPTIGEFKAFLNGGDSGPPSSDGTATPSSSDYGNPSSEDGSPPSSVGEIPETQKTAAPSFDFQRALKIISEESGVAISDLTGDTVFADAGVDSLLSLVISARLRDELNLDFESEQLLLEFPTVDGLKTALLGQPTEGNSSTPEPSMPNACKAVPDNLSQADAAALVSRKTAVDEFVQKYAAGFSAPNTNEITLPAPQEDENVVLVTGASGSLGSFLTYHVSQLTNVRRVICLNRSSREEPYKRQYKAMRDKGIRFPDALKSKVLVLETDTSRPFLGLDPDVYEQLVCSATHLIHNAWPMSAKRGLEGFESQFQVMKNLIQLACDVSARRRPEEFKFTFQLVSSIGVVGLYDKHSGNQKTMVPEERFGIEAILNNGYSDAKWGCERLIDETLHTVPGRFRAMVVRLGQIAGSKTSGYWNPMEHFGFLIKSSHTLKALPDLPGEVYWTPVNDIADTLADLALSSESPHRFYHIENPVGQPWSRVNAILAECLDITDLIPFEQWVERVRKAPQKDNPALTLLEFFDDNYIRMSCGKLVLEPKHTLEHSQSLRKVGPISEEVVRKYIHIWKEIGFLSGGVGAGAVAH